MAMQLNGQSLTDQTGTGFTLAVAGVVAVEATSMSGDITVTYGTGVLTGTWVVSAP